MRVGRLTRERLAAIERWAARESVECLYFLADSGDAETAPLAEESGFRLVDLRVTLERRSGSRSASRSASGPPSGLAISSAGPPAAAAPAGGAAGTGGGRGPETTTGPPVQVRPATAADLPRLRRIAAASHRDSRFYHDGHFDRRRCGELYAGWIEKSCADPAGVVLVAALPDPAGRPAGYVTGTIGEDGEGWIGLFAVAPDARGRGVGGALIAAVLDWFAGRGADPVSVVTQGRNVRAQRLYQRFGMRTRSVEVWFHRWWPAGPSGPGPDAPQDAER